MIKKKHVKRHNFLLLEILLAMTLFLAILPFVFKQFSQRRLQLEEKITELQIQKIKEESLFLIEQEIKTILVSNPLKIKSFQSTLNLCPQKIISSQKRFLDVFYSYKVIRFLECKKNEDQKIGVLIDISMTLFLPLKKHLLIERSLFFSYEKN